MKFARRVLIGMLFVLSLLIAPAGRAQSSAPKSETNAAPPRATETQKQNVQEYIALLRSNVRQEKAEIMGAMMLLNAQDAAKFWPIYGDYDTQLSKLNDQRVQIIEEYAQTYNAMTDEKADELVQKTFQYQKERGVLLAQTYEKVKQALGGVDAARFMMIEHQLMLIIDLQVSSSLPVVGQGS
jgi:hypothetical protein